MSRAHDEGTLPKFQLLPDGFIAIRTTSSTDHVNGRALLLALLGNIGLYATESPPTPEIYCCTILWLPLVYLVGFRTPYGEPKPSFGMYMAFVALSLFIVSTVYLIVYYVSPQSELDRLGSTQLMVAMYLNLVAAIFLFIEAFHFDLSVVDKMRRATKKISSPGRPTPVPERYVLFAFGPESQYLVRKDGIVDFAGRWHLSLLDWLWFTAGTVPVCYSMDWSQITSWKDFLPLYALASFSLVAVSRAVFRAPPALSLSMRSVGIVLLLFGLALFAYRGGFFERFGYAADDPAPAFLVAYWILGGCLNAVKLEGLDL